MSWKETLFRRLFTFWEVLQGLFNKGPALLIKYSCLHIYCAKKRSELHSESVRRRMLCSLVLPAEPCLCCFHMQLARLEVRKQNDGDAFPNSLFGSLCNGNCLARPAASLLSVCLQTLAWINNFITVANPVSGKPPLLSWTCDCFCLPVFVHKYEAAACHL